MSIYRIAHGLARILIGVVFIYTGLIHIADPAGFAAAVAAYRILPPFSVNAFALLLPWVELLAGLAIATGIGLEGGALAAIGMLAVFLIALAASLYRGLDISCGCFSTSAAADRISWLYLVRSRPAARSTLYLCLSSATRAERTARASGGRQRGSAGRRAGGAGSGRGLPVPASDQGPLRGREPGLDQPPQSVQGAGGAGQKADQRALRGHAQDRE